LAFPLSGVSINRLAKRVIESCFGAEQISCTVDYLSPTLDALAKQMVTDPTDPMYKQVCASLMRSCHCAIHAPWPPRVCQIVVCVMNNDPQPETHTVFQQLKSRLQSNPGFLFVDNPKLFRDATPDSRDGYSSRLWVPPRDPNIVQLSSIAAAGNVGSHRGVCVLCSGHSNFPGWRVSLLRVHVQIVRPWLI
jgi:hypothetical protein